MSELAVILEANRQYALEHGSLDIPMVPARGLAILTCMDSRIQPYRVLGLNLGDAHVIRNAGGRASDDALRSLVVSVNLLGTREIMVIQHTNCGMQRFTDDDIREHLHDHLGVDASAADFLTFGDLTESVREDVLKLRTSPLLPLDITVHGLIFDVITGLLHPVEVPNAVPVPGAVPVPDRPFIRPVAADPAG